METNNKILIRFLVILFLGLLILSCKSVQKNVSKSEEELTVETKEESTTNRGLTVLQSVDREIDTSITTSNQSQTIIYPKGEIEIKLDGTFFGEVDSVKVIREEDSVIKNKSIDKGTIATTDTTKVSVSKNEEVVQKTAEVKKDIKRTPSTLPWIGGALGLLILFIGIGFARKKKIV